MVRHPPTSTPDRPPPRVLLWAWPLLLTGLALLANGYRFDTTDQAIHLTLLRELLDPGAMSGDLVATHATAHASLWWHLHAPLVRVLGWEMLPHLYLGLYLLALVATFALLMRLSQTLLGSPWHALLAPLLLVMFKACPAHVQTFEPQLINRTLTHPLLLGAVWLLLRGRPIHGAALCGLAFNLHATTATHTALALALATALDPGLRRKSLMAVGAFAVCAAPLAAMVALRGMPGTWWVDEEWMHVLRWRMPHHLFPDRWPMGVWVAAAFQLALWVVGSRWIPVRAVRLRGHLLVAGVLVCGPLLGTLAAEGVIPLAPLIALHPWESWILLAVLGYLAIAGPLSAALVHRRILPRVAAVILGAALAIGFESSAVGLRRAPTFHWQGPTGDEAALVEALEGPRFRISAGRSVLVPPQGMAWLRPWSGRAVFTTAKDGGEAVFHRDMALQWRFRLAELCGEDVMEGEPPKDEWLGYRSVGERAQQAFARQKDARLRQLASRQRAWLLVVPAELERPALTPVYANESYFVYDLRHPSSVRGAQR